MFPTKRMVWWLMFVIGMAGMNALVFGQGDTQFVPADPSMVGEQLPAARLVIAAYAFVWVAMLGYLFTIWRRLMTVEREMAQLSKQISKGRS